MKNTVPSNWQEIYGELRNVNAALRSEIKILKEGNLALKKEVLSLKEKLQTNSRNSSQPPSQDPFRSTQKKSPQEKNRGDKLDTRGIIANPIQASK